jgi:hypothetical protein
MPVYSDSRYADVSYTTVVGRDQLPRKYLHPRDPFTSEQVNQSWALHEVAHGDELDLLAYRYTADNPRKTKYWWMIADVNNIMWPLDVEPGTSIIIPTELLAKKGMK